MNPLDPPARNPSQPSTPRAEPASGLRRLPPITDEDRSANDTASQRATQPRPSLPPQPSRREASPRQEPTIDLNVSPERSSVALPLPRGGRVEVGVSTPPQGPVSAYGAFERGDLRAQVQSLPHGVRGSIERAGIPSPTPGGTPISAGIGAIIETNPNTGKKEVGVEGIVQRGRFRLRMGARTDTEPGHEKTELGAQLELFPRYR
ncbi:MAG: hypothetical protein U0136_19905 [Bdellovibrionota bacterium]